MSASFNRNGIGAEQDRQEMIRLAAEMRLVSQVPQVAKPTWGRTSYLIIAKLARLDRFRPRRTARATTVIP